MIVKKVFFFCLDDEKNLFYSRITFQKYDEICLYKNSPGNCLFRIFLFRIKRVESKQNDRSGKTKHEVEQNHGLIIDRLI